MSYIGSLQALIGRIGPWFLHSRNIGRFIESVGLTLDSALTSLDYGFRLSQPLRCHPSALPVIADNRTLRLYPAESELSKRTRLSQWLQLHRTRGTHIGEMKHSQPYFLPEKPVMRIVHQAGNGASATWWTLGADGEIGFHLATPSNWNYDNHPEKWSRFWVILYPPAGLMTVHTYDDGAVYDGGERYDGLVDLQKALDMVSMIIEWKSRHSRLGGYIIATDPASFDPTATAVTYSDGSTSLPIGNWGTPIMPSGIMGRLNSAIWLYER